MINVKEEFGSMVGAGIASSSSQNLWSRDEKSLACPIERRQGKWTRPECDYAALLIEHFASGRLPGCAGGESLRTTLAECLMCTPMRITKKLSATHAIGKSCFKKKGELTAQERVALEDARAAFLASVAPKAKGGEYHQRKRSRHPEPAPELAEANVEANEWLGELSKTSWLDAPCCEDNSLHGVDLGLSTGPPRAPHDMPVETPKIRPSVSARVTSEGRTAVRVVVADRDGLLGDISAVFKRRQLSIVGCTAETLAGDIAHDEFFLVNSISRKPVTDRLLLEQIEKDVFAALEHAATGGADASETSSIEDSEHVKMPDNNTAAATTSLRVMVQDRPGLLQQITTSLTNQRLSIVGAKIETNYDPGKGEAGKTANDVFNVVDAETQAPVIDPLRLRSIEEQLTNDLNAIPVKGKSNSVSSQNSNSASVLAHSDDGEGSVSSHSASNSSVQRLSMPANSPVMSMGSYDILDSPPQAHHLPPKLPSTMPNGDPATLTA